MRKAWTETEIQAAASLRGHASASTLAIMFETSRNSIINIWARAREADPTIELMQPPTRGKTNRLRGRPSVPVVDKRKAREMRAGGAKLREIAEEFGVTIPVIYRHVRDVLCPIERRGRPRKAA
jgi:hypothetical protein